MFACYVLETYSFRIKVLKRVDQKARGSGKELEGVKEVKGNYNQDIIYVKRIYF